MATGLMIKLMAKESTIIQMGLNMLGIGLKICNKVKAKILGRMEPFMRDNIKIIRKGVW